MSRAMRSQMATTSPYSLGKKASPPVTPARRRSTFGFRSLSAASKMPMVYTRAVDCPAICKTSARVCRLALSPPSLMTISTFFFGAAGPQSVARLEDGVVKRRHARGGCVGDGAPEVLGAIAEREVVGQAEGHLLVEVDDEHLVFGTAGLYERPGRRDHIRHLRAHASTVVDNQSHGDRNVFVAEQADGLANAVFVNLKILLAQIGSEAAFSVAHGGVQHHEIDVHGNLVGWRTLRFDGGRRLRLGNARETDQQQQWERHRVPIKTTRPRPPHDASIRRYSGCHMASCTCCTMS